MRPGGGRIPDGKFHPAALIDGVVAVASLRQGTPLRHMSAGFFILGVALYGIVTAAPEPESGSGL